MITLFFAKFAAVGSTHPREPYGESTQTLKSDGENVLNRQ